MQKLIYALKQVLILSEMIFTKLKLARQIL